MDAITDNDYYLPLQLRHHNRHNLLNINTIALVQKDKNESDAVDGDVFRLNTKIVTDGIITFETFKEAQLADPFCYTMMQNPGKSFRIQDNVLLKISKNDKLVLPTSLLPLLINSAHNTIFSIHLSKSQIYKKLSAIYFHPSMEKEIAKVVDSCYLCRISKSTTTQATHLGRKQYAETPRTEWLFDIAPMNPVRGFRYIYLFVDSFTQKTKLVAAKTRTTDDR